MIVGIVGSRDYPLQDRVVSFVRGLARKHPGCMVVSGGARGVDTLAELTAKSERLTVVSYRPTKSNAEPGRWQIVRHVDGGTDSTRYREFVLNETLPSFRDAAMFRNGLIVRDADVVVAFWDGVSRGTADSITKADAAGKQVFIYGPDGSLMESTSVLTALIG